MRSKTVLTTVILGIVLCGATGAKTQETGEASKQVAPKQLTAYRVDFSLNELEDAKTLNTRRYSMNLTDDNNGQDLKIGTRVPVQSDNGKFEYLDVGTSIRARLESWKTPLALDVRAEISNFATPDEATRGGHPLLRQMVISGSTIIVPDKPIIIGSVDDPNSKREYQLAVTVTKLR